MVYKKYENDKYKLVIEQDESPLNPREDYSNLGIMLCSHRKYNLGDKQFNSEDFLGWTDVRNYIKKELGGVVILPLYLYDHSGITMSTRPFACGWDSGCVGFIYTTKEKLEEFGIDIKDAEEQLINEVKTYDLYLTGEVYDFVLYEKVKCGCCKHIEYEVIDSCGGFFDYGSLEQDIKAQVDLCEKDREELFKCEV